MPSILGHSVLGITVAKIADKSEQKSLLLLSVISSVLPDLDVLSFLVGVPY